MEAVDILRRGLESTRKAVPSLASEIVPYSNGRQSGMIALRPGNFGSLLVKGLRGTGLVYEELRQQNFPTSKLDPEVLCDTVFAAPGDKQPVFVPRVSIIDGGLIITLSIHHVIFDAQGITEVLRVWSQNCHHLQDKLFPEMSSLPPETFAKPAHFTTHEPSAEKGRPEHHPEYLITPEPIAFGETAFREPHRTRVYLLTPKALAELKNDCTEPGKPWVSTNDAVNALVWRSVIRAQVDLDQYPESAMSHDIISVDTRLRSDPPLSKNYPGITMLYARPGFNLRELVNATNLAPIAQAVRVEIDKMNPDYVDSIVTLLNTIPGYDHWVASSFPLLMGTDINISTWYKVDIYDLNWGPVLGRVERLRFTLRGVFNGCTMIFPQVRKADGQEGMEVSIGLDQANFEKLNADPVWSKYAIPMDPGYDSLQTQ